MSISQQAQYQAYNMAAQTVGKTRQVVMLYDGVIRYMRQAGEAIRDNRIEDRFNLLVKASDVILGLQSCLDFENGGQVAVVLHDYYSSIDARILSIHRSNSIEMCEQIISELKEMRGAWEHIDRDGPEKVQASKASGAPTDAVPSEQAAAAESPIPPSGVFYSA